jgi:aminoglycoside phosphotransferase (APT) family kinase protein
MDERLVGIRARNAARMLRSLHDVEIQRSDLAAEPVLAIEDEIARWSATMSAVDQDLVRGADLLRARLLALLPRGGRVSVVHGDYRLGNILFQGSSASAIVDWEIWSVTDPRVDLGWFLISCDYPTFAALGTAAPGMPSTEELLAEYAGSGPAVGEALWFVAFAPFKMAAIMAHNLRRHREGRHHDPFQEKLPPTIASLIDRGLGILAGEESCRGR